MIARLRPVMPRTLVARVFAANAVLLCAACAVLLLSPVTVSDPVDAREALAIVAGLAAMLLVDLWLVRRAFAPLDRLRRQMERADLLTADGTEPGFEAVDEEVRRLAEAYERMLVRLGDERRESARRTLAAQEGERRRVSRELHDEVGQALTGLLLQVEQAATAPGPERDARLEDVRASARAALEDVRGIAQRLRPQVLDDLGLDAALKTLCTTFARDTGLPIRRRGTAEPLGLDAEAELAVYRIAQESLTNIARHAGATEVELALGRAGSSVRLVVRDDGRGLGHAGARVGGGLRGMHERAVLAGGTLRAWSPPDGGTIVRLDLPAAPAPPPPADPAEWTRGTEVAAR
jgi:two-component system sensor histidine kinase UhpB